MVTSVGRSFVVVVLGKCHPGDGSMTASAASTRMDLVCVRSCSYYLLHSLVAQPNVVR